MLCTAVVSTNNHLYGEEFMFQATKLRTRREHVRPNAEAALPPPDLATGESLLQVLRQTLANALEGLSSRLANLIRPRLESSGPTSDDYEPGERRVLIQERIKLLGAVLAALSRVDAADVAPGSAGLGSTVRARSLDGGDELEFVIVPLELVDGSPRKVTLASPIGQALLGVRTGDTVDIVTPSDHRRMRIESIETIWQAADSWRDEDST
jgi:transcription elongation GreA/GreB family factor